jgi:hypothetical protein
MKQKELKRMIAEELNKLREAMPLPPDEEYESGEIDIETQRAMDMGIIPYPDGSYRQDDDDDRTPDPDYEEDEGDRFSPEQREQDARLENPDLYYGDDDEDMRNRTVADRLKDLLRDVEAGSAAVRAGEDYDFINPDALKAAKSAMMEDPDGETDAVEDAIYAKLYYEYFPEFL